MYKITILNSWAEDFTVSTREQLNQVRKEYRDLGVKVKATKINLFK